MPNDPQSGWLVPPEFARQMEEDEANGVIRWEGETVAVTFDPDYTVADCLRDRGLEHLIENK